MLRIEKVTPKNLSLAIGIQKQLFPNESGKVDLENIAVEKCSNQYSLMLSWLGFENDKLVGMVGLYAYKAYLKDAWLGWFGVLEKFRRKGFGAQLFEFAKKQAKDMGFENLRLYTDDIDNFVATKFYDKMGMTSEVYDNPSDKHFEVGKTLIYSLSLCGKKADAWESRNLFLNLHEKQNEEK